MSSSLLYGCAKHRLAEEDSVEEEVIGVEGGKSKVMIDGSPFPDMGEIKISSSSSAE